MKERRERGEVISDDEKEKIKKDKKDRRLLEQQEKKTAAVAEVSKDDKVYVQPHVPAKRGRKPGTTKEFLAARNGKKLLGKRRGRKPKYLKILEEKRLAKKLKMQDKLKKLYKEKHQSSTSLVTPIVSKEPEMPPQSNSQPLPLSQQPD